MTGAAGESWCVAGGGMLGQVLALRLAEAGHQVTLCEAAPEIGGLASAWELGGLTWDRFYHVILPADRRLVALLDEIGLADRLVWKRSSTGFFARGRMSPLDGAADYLRLPVLGPIAKARLAFTLMMAARIRDGRPLERVLVADWLRRWSGRAAYERLWRPLLRAKLGDNAAVTSAAFIWATIRRLYLARSAGAKTETLGFVEGGYAAILARLGARLQAAGVRVLTGCPIARVAPHAGRMRVETGQGAMVFDHVVSTLPAGPTAAICPDLSSEVRARLDGVVYQGIICASLVLDQPLGGHYLTYLTDEDLPFTAIVETSALTGNERFGGRTLAYLPRYVTQDDQFWALDDAEVRVRFLAGLAQVFREFDPGKVQAFRVARVRQVMAVPTLGYSDNVPGVATNLPGFHIVNSAQITDGTLNVDATLGVVERALPVLLGAGAQQGARDAA